MLYVFYYFEFMQYQMNMSTDKATAVHKLCGLVYFCIDFNELTFASNFMNDVRIYNAFDLSLMHTHTHTHTRTRTRTHTHTHTHTHTEVMEG